MRRKVQPNPTLHKQKVYGEHGEYNNIKKIETHKKKRITVSSKIKRDKTAFTILHMTLNNRNAYGSKSKRGLQIQSQHNSLTRN